MVGVLFSYGVNLSLISYLVGSYNLSLYCFGKIIYGTCGVVVIACQLSSGKICLR